MSFILTKRHHYGVSFTFIQNKETHLKELESEHKLNNAKKE